MGRKLTQEEAEQRSINVGIHMVGLYKTNHISTTFECPECDEYFECRPCNIWSNNTRSCGCLYGKSKYFTQAEAEQKSREVGVEMTGQYIGCMLKTKFKCPECDKYFECVPSDIWSKHTRSCGCLYSKLKYLTQLEAESKSDAVGVKMTSQYMGNDVKIKFECPDCHRDWMVTPKSVWAKNTISCGCQYAAKMRKRHGLSINEVKRRSLEAGCQFMCEYINLFTNAVFICPICKEAFYALPSNIWSGKTKSCGNCQLKRNGVTTSYAALSLEQSINSLFPNHPTSHNYKTRCHNDSRDTCIDIAILLPAHGFGVAIEYDEWYNHGYKLHSDRLRLRKLHRNGWKTLRIKASSNQPDPKVLQEKLLDLLNTPATSRTITLEGWGSGPTRKTRKIRKTKKTSKS